jgi:cell division protein ZapE
MKSQLSQISQKYNLSPSERYLNLVHELELTLAKINNYSGLFASLKASPKGFYIYGSTGSGKTTLMNAFFGALNVSKINIHFHDYFLDISRLLTKYSMKILVSKISKAVKVLCFDEFFIESIADARLLQDLFEGLIKKGVIIVLTSNFEPEKLYENGFNREVVFPNFSNFLRANLQVFNLSSNFDFREQNRDKTSLMVEHLPEGFTLQNLEFEGHILTCRTLQNMVIFEYGELFSKPRSVVQFIDICRHFDKIYIANFKPFTKEREDELIRFRNFVDVAYLRHNSLHLQGKFSEKEIFTEAMLEDIKIKRTYSRLSEMSSLEFLSEENLLKRKWQTEARILLNGL